MCIRDSLCHRLGKVCEQHRDKQDNGDHQIVCTQAGIRIAEQARENGQQQRDNKAHFHHEHNRIFDHVPGIQFFYCADERLMQDLRGQDFLGLLLTHTGFPSLAPQSQMLRNGAQRQRREEGQRGKNINNKHQDHSLSLIHI